MTGWTNYDGSEVTGSTIVSTNDVLSAVWDTVNPLVPETLGEGAGDTSKAQKYDAYILDGEGTMRGTVAVTVGKSSRSTGLSSVKAQVKLVGESKTYVFKAAGGKATFSADAATEGVELHNSQLGTMTLDFGAEGVSGTLGESEIDGSRNTYKDDKAAYATWEGVWSVAVADEATGAYSTFSVKVKKTGSVTVRGVMADGAKLSATTGTVPCSARMAGSLHTSMPPKSSSPLPAYSRDRKQRTMSSVSVLPAASGTMATSPTPSGHAPAAPASSTHVHLVSSDQFMPAPAAFATKTLPAASGMQIARPIVALRTNAADAASYSNAAMVANPGSTAMSVRPSASSLNGRTSSIR